MAQRASVVFCPSFYFVYFVRRSKMRWILYLFCSGRCVQISEGKVLSLGFYSFYGERVPQHAYWTKCRGREGKNVWFILKCGQNCLLFILQLILEPTELRDVLLPSSRLESSTLSKSALRRLIFKLWEWKMGGFDYRCSSKPAGRITRPLFPLMCLSSLAQKCFGSFRGSREPCCWQWLIDARLPLRVFHLQKHDLHSSDNFCLRFPAHLCQKFYSVYCVQLEKVCMHDAGNFKLFSLYFDYFIKLQPSSNCHYKITITQ